MDDLEAALAQATFSLHRSAEDLLPAIEAANDRDAVLAAELSVLADLIRWAGQRLESTASAWLSADSEGQGHALVVGVHGETIVSIADGAATIARYVERADGEWVTSSQLRDHVLADPELGPVVRTACEEGRTRWWNPRLLAGNVVGWWSKSWTDGTNPYLALMERDGKPGGPYRYRLRPAQARS